MSGRKRWLFVDAKVKSAFLEVPEEPPTKWARWGSQSFEGRKLERVYERMQQLRGAGVTGQIVARDFTRRRIAPLQERSEPVWRYSGRSDPMRLCTDNLAVEVLDSVMGILFTTPAIPAPTDDTRPIFQFTEEGMREYLASLPKFDEWGIMPKGHTGMRDNPDRKSVV